MPYRDGLRVIRAVKYTYQSGRELTCYLDEQGRTDPYVRRYDGRPIVLTKAGEAISVFGDREVVAKIEAIEEPPPW